MSAYKPYPKYNPSNVEWLGDVPEHWTKKAIKWESNVSRGASPRPIDDPIYFDEEGKYAWVRIADVTSAGRYLVTTTQRLSALGSSLSVKLQPGTLFLSIAGSVGKPCITRIECCIHDGFVHFPSWRSCTNFLYYIFASGEPYKGLGKFGTQLNLNTDTVGGIHVALPSLPEQHMIVAFLDRECGKLDTLQAKQERLIELLKEKRVALISHAVTRGLDPTAQLKCSGVEWIGRVPEHWEIQPLSYVCRFQSGKAHEPFIDDDGEFVCVNSRFVSTEGESRKFCSKNLSPAKSGDVLMVMSDLPNGRALAKAYFVSENEKLAVNQRVCILTAQSSDPKFLYYYLDRNQGFLRHDDGVSQTHLSNSDFTKLKLPVPPVQEQLAIVAHLDEKCEKIDQLKAKAERGIELLKERRSALISAAVTGKIDVREPAN